MNLTAANVATNLRTAREACGWTQEQLGARSGFKPTAISHFECGQRKPSLENFCRLCNVLGVEPQQLLK